MAKNTEKIKILKDWKEEDCDNSSRFSEKQQCGNFAVSCIDFLWVTFLHSLSCCRVTWRFPALWHNGVWVGEHWIWIGWISQTWTQLSDFEGVFKAAGPRRRDGNHILISFKGGDLGIWGQMTLFDSRCTILYCNMGHWRLMFQIIYDWAKNYEQRKRWKIREEKEIMIGKISREEIITTRNITEDILDKLFTWHCVFKYRQQVGCLINITHADAEFWSRSVLFLNVLKMPLLSCWKLQK